MTLLKNKVALVTGGARGIGAGIVLALAEQGAQVVFTYVNDSSYERSMELEKQVLAKGIGKAKAYQSNASVFTSCETLVNNVLKDFGTIDICVNNAGIAKDNLLLRVSPEQWQETLNTNLNSVYNLTKLVIKTMMKNQSGSIINMSSIIGITGNAGQTAYAASKAGIIGFTKSVAKELGSRNIRCNAIAPGFIETEMTQSMHGNPEKEKAMLQEIPLGRIGKAHDIGQAVVFLASDMSAYITGQVLSVCGGMNI
ncbi:MAG: 3-oxoacyl-[acyl-carrier-protein] reductase [Phycisphaerales bacterium]|nr:3-oxoacyl-[acyl-carrier-protein] reductase [Phycisphaerales bacterium]